MGNLPRTRLMNSERVWLALLKPMLYEMLLKVMNKTIVQTFYLCNNRTEHAVISAPTQMGSYFICANVW